MAIAPVLKTGVRKDLQVRILYPPFLRLVLPLLVALLATAATPRSTCACSTKLPAYRAAMKSDLRNLVTAQELFRADSGRFASSLRELGTVGYRLSTGVELMDLASWQAGFRAKVSYPSGLTETCWITVGELPDGSKNKLDGEPQCDPSPDESSPVIAGVTYFALLLIAIFIRYDRAGFGLPAVRRGTVLRFATLFLVHPFWPISRRDASCYANAERIEMFWVLLMAGIAVWMATRIVEPEEPPRAA